MKNWKRLLTLFLSGVMALSLCACDLGGSTESPSADPSASLSTDPDTSASPEIEVDLTQDVLQFSAGLSSDDVLFTINGAEVHADLFLYMLSINCARNQTYLSYYGMTLSDVADALLQDAVYMTTYHTVIRQKAAELGCLPTDAQAEEISKAVEESGLDNAALFWGLTPESAEFITAADTYYNNVLAAITHDPSTEELNDYLYRVKHILIKTVGDNMNPLPEDQLAEKKTQAEDLLAQLQAADDLPALFDQLMNEYSEDGRTEDGALAAPDGYLAAPGQMVAEFEEASKALEVGEISGLVESTYGYHIILRLPTDVTEEELAQADYAEGFRQDAFNTAVTQWLEEAETTRADAIAGLDVEDFYNRLTAYQRAAAAQQQPEESAPVESGGVG